MGGSSHIEIRPHSADGNLGSSLLRKSELSCRDTAESDALQTVRIRQSKTGVVTVCQFLLLFGRRRVITDDGADRMQHMTGRQVIAVRNFCPSRRFRMPLRLHQPIARQTQLHPGRRVDGIVYTAVHRHETTQ